MTSPGGPGYPGGQGGSWSGDDPGFGVPQQPQTPYPQQQQPAYPPQQQAPPGPQHQQPQQQPVPGQPSGAGGQGAPGPGGAHAGGSHGRPEAATTQGPHWGRIGLVAGAAVVVVVAIVLAAMWILGGSSGAVDSTRKFFKAVQTENTQAAAEVTCTQAPTLAEQFSKAIKGVEGTLGTLDKVDVSAPETSTTAANSLPQQASSDEKREAADFDLVFANGSVHGRATLVDEDGKLKVCFVDLDPPKTN